MTQVALDPTMFCMAVAIMAVEKKLDAIHEKQKEILVLLELKEDDTCLSNEVMEVKINKIRRYQQVVNKLKANYKTNAK